MTTYQHIQSNKRKTTLLIALFLGFIVAIGWIFSDLLGYGPDALLVATVIAVIMSGVSYFSSSSIALWTAGARPISKEDSPYVFRLVENLCMTAGIPLPKIYLISDPTLNAFATGRNPDHASIALTTGIIDALENEELEGVVAHELSHIKNYDTRLMTVVIVCVGIISLLAHSLLRFRLFGGRRDDRESGQLGFVLVIVGVVLSLLSPVIAQLIQLAISRKREFLADASAVLLTRYPQGLAGALKKIATTNRDPLRTANPATAHLYISNPFGSKTSHSLTRLFSTHPPISDRIRALEGMA